MKTRVRGGARPGRLSADSGRGARADNMSSVLDSSLGVLSYLLYRESVLRWYRQLVQADCGWPWDEYGWLVGAGHGEECAARDTRRESEPEDEQVSVKEGREDGHEEQVIVKEEREETDEEQEEDQERNEEHAGDYLVTNGRRSHIPWGQHTRITNPGKRYITIIIAPLLNQLQ